MEELDRLAKRFGISADELLRNPSYLLLVLEKLFERLDEIEAKLTK